MALNSDDFPQPLGPQMRTFIPVYGYECAVVCMRCGVPFSTRNESDDTRILPAGVLCSNIDFNVLEGVLWQVTPETHLGTVSHPNSLHYRSCYRFQS
jgi:hypothetical protein